MGEVYRITHGQTTLKIDVGGLIMEFRHFYLLPPSLGYKGGGNIAYGLCVENGRLVAEPVGRCYGSDRISNSLTIASGPEPEDREWVRSCIQSSVFQLPLLEEFGPIVLNGREYESGRVTKSILPPRSIKDEKQLALV